MKKVILILFFLFPTFCFSQSFFQNIKNESNSIKYFALNYNEMNLLDSFGIIYCPPLYRWGILDSIPYYIKNPYFVNLYKKHIENNFGDEFPPLPQHNRVIISGYYFTNKMEYYDEYSKKINDEFFNYSYFDVIGIKEYEISKNSKPINVLNLSGDGYYTIHPNNFVSILIVEKFYPEVKQVIPSIYLKYKNGEFVDPGMNMSNIMKLGL